MSRKETCKVCHVKLSRLEQPVAMVRYTVYYRLISWTNERDQFVSTEVARPGVEQQIPCRSSTAGCQDATAAADGADQ